MSLVLSSKILFAVCVIVSHVFFFYRKRKKISKKYLVCSYIITGLSMLLIHLAVAKESSTKWRNSAFEGVIVSVVVTEEHAIREYRIKQENNISTFRDSWGKLYHLQIGDYVKKQAGKDSMEVKSK